MFRSNKYLLLASLVGILSVVALILFYRHLAFASLMDQETRSNVALTQSLANSILPAHAGFLATAGGLEVEQLVEHEEVAKLDAAVRRQMRGSTVVKVKVYDLEGLTVYSSDPTQIGQNKGDNPGFLQARNGLPASHITFRDNFSAFEGNISHRDLVATYIPVSSAARLDRVSAVFEVYSDVTELVAGLHRTEKRILIGVLGSISLVYVLLAVIARRADQTNRIRERERIASEAKIRYQAYHDDLTHLPNRTSFAEHLDEAIKRASRRGGLLGLLFLDLDQFKLVNDSLGHDAGDELLRLAAHRFKSCTRESDMLFRMGGDEFTVICEGMESPEATLRVANRILDSLKQPVVLGEHSIVVTTSIGISIYPRDATSSARLVKDADVAMYLAKQSGRNRFRFYTAEMNQSALDQLELESALQRALENKEFVLHYQPRFAGDCETVLCVEALLRWQRSDDRLEPPLRFIPILEQTGLIDTVGEWVVRTACRQCKAWQDEGLAPIRMSVNISPQQFRADNFAGMIKRVLIESRLAPEYLELELTESALLNNPDRAIELMKELKEIGISISIDDFGSGYSSFQYLKMLPVDYLKIDRSFVRDVMSNEKDAAIIKAVAALAGSLRLGLVAEGIENRAQADFMVSQSCHELQGFLLSRPKEPEAISRMLREQACRTHASPTLRAG